MLKSKLLVEIQTELHRHNFDSFVDEPPSVAQGERGVVVAGCPKCKKRLTVIRPTTGSCGLHVKGAS
jgi:hypothetical protein